MQGPGTENHAKISAVLALCILFALIAAGLIGCDDKPTKHKPQPIAQYEEGQIVYLKPDSTIGVIGQVNVYMSSGVEYRIGYKNNQGVIEYHDFTESQIYGKK